MGKQVSVVVGVMVLLVGCTFDEGGFPGGDDDPAGPDAGAGDPGDPADPVSNPCPDNDGDGFFGVAGCGTLVDCVDEDDAIFPGRLEFASDAYDNDRYDYNCDGDDEREFVGKSEDHDDNCQSGWNKKEAKCGELKRFDVCGLVLEEGEASCECDRVDRLQRCR